MREQDDVVERDGDLQAGEVSRGVFESEPNGESDGDRENKRGSALCGGISGNECFDEAESGRDGRRGDENGVDDAALVPSHSIEDASAKGGTLSGSAPEMVPSSRETEGLIECSDDLATEGRRARASDTQGRGV